MTSAQPTGTKYETIWFDPVYLPEVSSSTFDASYWREKQALIGSSVGRGTTYFFKEHQHEFVLRHYLRGGLVGKILNDQYLFTGIANTRAWQEKALLSHIRKLGLPAPTPAAARVTKHWGYYRADLITVKIPNAQDVHHHLLKHTLSNEVWTSIGKTIAQFHQHQIYHHDLNIHNIMLDKDNKVWLIDFDKCTVKPGDHWKQDNLDRLHRSLQKESAMNVKYFFEEHAWNYIIEGYKASNSKIFTSLN
ncbi:3-deoxy-D-manno-octulosonic acid kinase [Aliiglaciecola sp. LCG003]|uniref:3-deoxy-D-manno-octulosonic acid kinase n=1 Tax=Aliiglaciecola sp. LCG003 TaxID=3053655 RepID=UPI002573811B|nr:3-deoxy-D-manno-octulosonic acid kinase [Aliiglaciecola sp. LCG003]WJG09514.1 3-deoxy-D-manno-octulosonic acid kinase [Aliiglaciecola sp. LCG003]